MSITGKTTRVAEALALLIDQYKDKANINTLLQAFAEQSQLFEDALIGTQTGRFLSVAVGEQLDGIGRIVGQPRNGQIDAVYRVFLSARISTNKSSGTAEEVLLAATNASGVGFTFILSESFPADPAHFNISANEPYADEGTANVVAGFIFANRAAGVRGIFSFGIVNTDFFTYDGLAAEAYDNGFYRTAVSNDPEFP